MELQEILLTFLMSAAGLIVIVAIGRYLWNLAGKYIKKTENTIDDKLYTVTPRIIREVLDEYDLGVRTEKILRKIFIEHEKIPADTSKMEESLKNEAEKAAKKSL